MPRYDVMAARVKYVLCLILAFVTARVGQYVRQDYRLQPILQLDTIPY